MILDWKQHRSVIAGFAAILLALLPAAGAHAPKPKKHLAQKSSLVAFAPRGGAYATNVQLRLSTAADAPIRYTLDGSEPELNSSLYASPLTVTNTTLVRARAFPKDAPAGMATAEIYTRLDDDVADFSSNLPLIIINSFGTNISHDRKIEGAAQAVDGGKERTRLTGPVDYSGRCLLNIRGRASLRYPKNSFTMKTIDGEGDSASVSILGFPPESDWVLYAPYPDKTLMRDVLGYELHSEMGHWAPRTRFVEVFVSQDGERLSRRDYVGVYVLVERITRNKSRVDITKLKPSDNSEPEITGGYVFKKDHIDSGGGPMGGEGFGAGPVSQSTRAGYPTGPGGFPADPKGFEPPARVTYSTSSSSSSHSSSSRMVTNHIGYAASFNPWRANSGMIYRDEFESPPRDEEGFKTTHTNQFYFVEPEPDELTAVQKAWLKNYLNEAEAAIFGPAFTDSKNGYRAYIDPDSFIDYHLITETTKNVDGFRFSVYYHKDRAGKIKADPIWDWNLSFGNANGKEGWIPEYWLWPQLDDKEYTWYRRLFEDPDFGQRYVDRFSQLRTNVLATQKVLGRVDELAALLQESQKRNFERWPILGRAINPNYFVGSSYDEELNFMKKFIQTRLDWIEQQFPPVPKAVFKSGPKGKILEMVASADEIFFTLDGSDPRASGGGVSKGVMAYTIPIPLPAKAKLFARVRQANRWSAPFVWAE